MPLNFLTSNFGSLTLITCPFSSCVPSSANFFSFFFAHWRFIFSILSSYILFWILSSSVTSLGFPYFPVKMRFALLYPSAIKGIPSINSLAFDLTNSFKHKHFATGGNLDLSVFTSDWLQKRPQSFDCLWILWLLSLEV